LKILFLNQAFYPDVVSSAQHAADLAAHLSGEGHEVHAVAGARGYDNPSNTFAREEIWKGIRIHRVPSGSMGKRTRWTRAYDFAFFLICLSWRLITLPRFDVVVAMTTPPLIGFLASWFVRLKGGRLVYWVMDMNPDQAIAAGWLRAGSVPARVFGWMLNHTLRSASRIVVLDRFMQDRVLEKGARSQAIDVVPPWSHDPVVHADTTAREDFRREHGLTGKFVVMYSGNHSPCHPLKSLLDAAFQLRERTDIQFVFIGGGSEHPRVKAFAAEHGLSNITVLPYQPIERVGGSLGSADLHVVVMGDPFVGMVHPCKIYNILSLGIPVLYIGPDEGHIPDMIPVEAYSRWFRAARHGESERIASQIVGQVSRPSICEQEEQHIARGFAAGVLIDRMASSIRSLAPRAKAAGASGSLFSRSFAGVAAAFLLCYAVVVARLFSAWQQDANMSHGFFVPFLVAYAVWQERDALRRATPGTNWFGLVLMLFGAVLLCIGPPNLDTFALATRLAFVVSLVGVILFLRGFRTLRILTYPLLLTLLMIPLPGFVVERLTFPLQMFASRFAERALEVLGYSVLREGNILRLPGATLSVAEACSGLRSMCALTFLGQAYVCMFDGRRWMRPVMAFLVIPIAVFANGFRILITAVAGSYKPEWMSGLAHESTGWVVFVIAFVFIVMFHVSLTTIERRLRREPASL
jgi:colanic acid biosynthesis glycosyl transferase WcaI